MTSLQVRERPVHRPGRTRSASWLRTSRLPIYAVTVISSLLVWQLASMRTSPLFLPSPALVAQTGWELLGDGTLVRDARASLFRILVGWSVGALVAVPLGVAAGRVRVVRVALEPVVNLFRNIPPIAFIALTIIWFGVGEMGKIALIIYTSAFLVFINTLTGAQSVGVEKIRAAQSLGASRARVLLTVVVPATVPHIVTGLRLAMGTAFMTVVAAELVAADSGLGFLIYNSRVFGDTAVAFVGIATLGLLGLTTDLLLQLALRRVTYRFDVKF